MSDNRCLRNTFIICIATVITLTVLGVIGRVLYCWVHQKTAITSVRPHHPAVVPTDTLKDVDTQLAKAGVHVLRHVPTPSPTLSAIVTNRGVFYVDSQHHFLIYGVMINLQNGTDESATLTRTSTAQLQTQLMPVTPETVAPVPVSQPLRSHKAMPATQLQHAAALTQSAVADNMQKLFSRLLFHYPAIGKKRGSITVFARPNCEYCHEFFTYTRALQHAGVSVRYVFAPIPAGLPTPSNNDLREAVDSTDGMAITKALCTKNKTAALTAYITQGIVPTVAITPACRGAEYAAIKYMYQTLQVPLTPFIVLSTGAIIRGVPHHLVQTITQALDA